MVATDKLILNTTKQAQTTGQSYPTSIEMEKTGTTLKSSEGQGS
jgi:hypothetical protein